MSVGAASLLSRAAHRQSGTASIIAGGCGNSMAARRWGIMIASSHICRRYLLLGECFQLSDFILSLLGLFAEARTHFPELHGCERKHELEGEGEVLEIDL